MRGNQPHESLRNTQKVLRNSGHRGPEAGAKLGLLTLKGLLHLRQNQSRDLKSEVTVRCGTGTQAL